MANYSAHMLKKNNKVERIEMQSQAWHGVGLTYEPDAALREDASLRPMYNLNASQYVLFKSIVLFCVRDKRFNIRFQI